MAALTTNDILSSILGQITVMNKNMQANVSKSDPKMSKLTDPVSSIKSKLGGVGDVANSISTLAKIPLKDVAKVSIMPLGIISKKIKTFIETLGDVKAESIKSSTESVKSFDELIDMIQKIDIKKLTKTLSKFPEKELTGFVNTVGKVLDEFYNKITKQFNATRRKVLNEALIALRTFVDDVRNTVKRMATIGLIGAISFPFILLGFAITAFTLKGLNILAMAIEYMGNPVKAVKNKIATNNINSFAKGALLILLSSMAIGALLLFVPGALKVLGLGFGTVIVTVLTFGLISLLLNKVVGGAKAKTNMDNVKGILTFAGGAMLIALASIGLGMLILSSGAAIAVGLGATVVIIGAFIGISWLLGKANKTISAAKKPLVNVMVLAFGSILLSGLMIVLGKYVNEAGGWAAMGSALAAIGLTILEFGGIAFALGKLKSTFKKAIAPTILVLGLGYLSVILTGIMFNLGTKISEAGGWAAMGSALGAVAATVIMFGVIAGLIGAAKSILLKGTLAYGLILGLGYFTVKLTDSVLNLGIKMKQAGGWKVLGPALGAVAAIIGEFAVIAAAIGALMMIPLLPLILGSGVAAVAAIGGAALLAANAGNKVMDLALKMQKMGGVEGPMKNLESFIWASRSLMLSMRGLAKGINFHEINKTLYALNGILFSMSKFAKILFGVGGKAGYMKSISGYDSKGNPIYDTEGIDIKLTSQNLAEGFAIFTEIIITKLDELKEKTVKFNTIAAITAIMNPVAKFAEILKSFATDKEGQIQVVHMDKEGKITGKDIIDIPKVSKSIAAGFGIFTSIILNALQKMDAKFKDVYESIKIAFIMDPIIKLVDDMKNLLDENTRPQMITNAHTIGEALSILNLEVFPVLREFDKTPSKRTIVKGTESIVEFSKLIGGMFKSTTDRIAFKDNIIAIGEGLEFLKENTLLNLNTFDKMVSKRTIVKGTESIVEFSQLIGGIFKSTTDRIAFKDNIIAIGEGLEFLKENTLLNLNAFDKMVSKINIVYGVEAIVKFGQLIGGAFKSAIDRISFKNNAIAIAKGLEFLKANTIRNLNAFDKMISKRNIVYGAEAIAEFGQIISQTFKDDMSANRFVKNAFAAEMGISKLNRLYLGVETKNLNKVLPILTKNHIAFISKMAKDLNKIKDPLKKYTESVERLADAYDKLNAHFDADGKLVLTLDESTVNNNTYNIDKNSIGAFTESLDETLSGIIPRMADAIRDVIDGAQFDVPAITLPNGKVSPLSISVNASK